MFPQRMTTSGKFRHRRKHSVEIKTDILQDEFNHRDVTPVEESKNHSSPEAATSPSNSLKMLYASQLEQNMGEQWAATRIQTAFRGFLARRALRALKGLVRLQVRQGPCCEKASGNYSSLKTASTTCLTILGIKFPCYVYGRQGTKL